MEQREIKMALGRHVVCRMNDGTESLYILRGVTIRKTSDGEFAYFAELLDIPSNGRGILNARLEDVRLSDEYFRKETEEQ